MNQFAASADEFISSTKISREMGAYLDSFEKQEREKYIIVKNNTPEAVLMDLRVYEELVTKLAEFEELIEDMEIAELISRRRQDKGARQASVKLKELGRRYGLEG